MKLKVWAKRHFGRTLYYPRDEFSSGLLSAFRSSTPLRSFTPACIAGLKRIGFEIEIESAVYDAEEEGIRVYECDETKMEY